MWTGSWRRLVPTSPSHPAAAPLTTQQPLLRDQHAGEGEGLLVVALEPLVHHLQAGPRPPALGGARAVHGGGRGAHSCVGNFRQPQSRWLRPSTDIAWPLLWGLRLMSTDLELSTSPWGNAFCTWQ